MIKSIARYFFLVLILCAARPASALILPKIPGVVSPAFTDVEDTTMTVHFSSGTSAGGYNLDGATYTIRFSTASDFSGTLITSQTVTLQAELYGLTPNTTYYAGVAAVVGLSTSTYAELGAVLTRAARPSGVVFTEIYLTSAAVSWQANGNPTGTFYETIHWNQFTPYYSTETYTSSSVITGLMGGLDTSVSVRARNWAGDFSDYSVAVSTFIISQVEDIPPGSEGNVYFNGPSGLVTVTVPDGAFVSTMTLSVRTPAAGTVPAAGSGLAALPTPVAVQVTLNQAAQPAKGVTLKVLYQTSDLGSMDENSLVLARYDTEHAVWVPLITTRDPVNNTVTAVTDHLSLFQVMAFSGGASLRAVTAGPIPWQVSRSPATPIKQNRRVSPAVLFYQG